MMHLLSCIVFFLISTPWSRGLEANSYYSSFTRRNVFASVAAAAATATSLSLPSSASNAAENAENAVVDVVDHYHFRDRKNNKNALIREDYWFMMGKTPPRVLETPLQGDDPKFNAFGACESKDGGNPCTYVSLKQRAPAYAKYGNSIAAGAREMQALGRLLQQIAATSPTTTTTTTTDASSSSSSSSLSLLWDEAALYVTLQEQQLPPPLVDVELKMVLLATALTTSPNFPLPSRELLGARFYAHECHYSSGELLAAIQQRDIQRALQAYEFGKDSWNSYMLVVNRSISEKVGDKFQAIV